MIVSFAIDQILSFDFSALRSYSEAQKVAMNLFGKDCPCPYMLFRKDTKYLTPTQISHFHALLPRLEEANAVIDILHHIESHTWMYRLGYRPDLPGRIGKIIDNNCSRQLDNIRHTSAWRVLARRIGIDPTLSICNLIWAIVHSDLVSDFEIGIEAVFSPSDITGSGSILDPDGRDRLVSYFHIPPYSARRNEILVEHFDHIRNLAPKN